MLTSKQSHVVGVRCVCVLFHMSERERVEVKNESVNERLQVYICVQNYYDTHTG